MNTHYDAIYLSPHLDDAALSCGGHIAQQTAADRTVLIVTIMAGEPRIDELSDYVRSLHERWDVDLHIAGKAVQERRAEDVTAAHILGADTLHWSVPDCIYRVDPVTGQPLYRSDEDIFGAIPPAEAGLVDDIAHFFAQLPPHERVYVPLTVGHHVDHQLVRAAAEACFGHDLFYYEEYPYVQQDGALAVAIPDGSEAWQPVVVQLTERAIRTKMEAIRAFRSQLSTFFADGADLERQVRGYIATVGGERVWRRVL